MKNLILIFSLFTLLSFSPSSEIKTNDVDKIVYVCGKSDIYHPTTSHASFKRCKSKILEMTEKEAIASGRRKCKCKG
ncbi:hypothetical protein [Flavobacterium sp.]|uniref:hypothetical protein n=1 Tax=Flavobacterium sp. TaxID=239 RepID=UPI003527D077